MRSGFPKRSCSNNNLKRDDDSSQSHRALGDRRLRLKGSRALASAPASAMATKYRSCLRLRVMSIYAIADFQGTGTPRTVSRSQVWTRASNPQRRGLRLEPEPEVQITRLRVRAPNLLTSRLACSLSALSAKVESRRGQRRAQLGRPDLHGHIHDSHKVYYGIYLCIIRLDA